MRSASTHLAVAAVAAIIAIPIAVLGAEEAGPDRTGNAYFSGTLRLGAATDEGESTEVDDGYDVRGARFDLPLETTDPRMTGLLSISANETSRWDGYGGAIGSRTYRLANDGGTWSGSGTSAIADAADGEDRPLAIETAVLVGEGGYEGLVAYVHMEQDWDINVFESQVRGLILAADPPPMSDPVESSGE